MKQWEVRLTDKRGVFTYDEVKVEPSGVLVCKRVTSKSTPTSAGNSYMRREVHIVAYLAPHVWSDVQMVEK